MMVCTRRYSWSVFIALALAPVAWAAESAETILSGYGLQPDGHTWTLPEHQRLRRLLHRFEGQLRSFHRTEQAWRQQIEEIDALEKRLQHLETRYEESRRLLQQQTGNLVVQQQLQEQRGQLSQRIGDVRLALKKQQSEEHSDVYEAARRHAAARAELLSTTSAIEEAQSRLVDRYESLRASAAVRQALEDLSRSTEHNHELASANSQRQQVEAAVRQAGKVLESGELPLLLTGGAPHVDAIAGGRPTTFAVDEDHPQTLIPLSHAERLGIDLGDQALWQTLTYGDRELRLCSAKLAVLQIGQATLSDVDVYVTSPAGADLGLRLGSEALDRVQLTVDRGRARIEVRPSSSRIEARQ